MLSLRAALHGWSVALVAFAGIAGGCSTDTSADSNSGTSGSIGNDGSSFLDGSAPNTAEAAASAFVPARGGYALVAGGTSCTSERYRAVIALTNSSGGPGKLSSSEYELVSGSVAITHP